MRQRNGSVVLLLRPIQHHITERQLHHIDTLFARRMRMRGQVDVDVASEKYAGERACPPSPVGFYAGHIFPPPPPCVPIHI